MTINIAKTADPAYAKKKMKKRLLNQARRTDGRWRLDFSRKNNDKPETDEQRRSRIKQWLEHNYPHVMRTGDEDEAAG